MSAQTELQQAETETAGSCCSPSGSCHSGGAAETPQGAVTTVYEVTGMTCGHCEGAVAGEISELAGVSSVKAVASTGQVTVVSDAPLDEAAVRAAVDEAGYELTGVKA
ncbi:heavy-metal-associated domain-containing protein [Streptomyces sp. NBC_01381]|uniref:heavy-metal-associated domain-containing protein n=1 Tax=unclassified Streptomyces TaxID=2593676 RepID=UPI002254E921|nr:heavy-metal-associated domain-containing protein [Streptomyces sp. NBC_01381]MCX4667107.1 heavy-metal-associated domain-containing protein [Streptomyces sp. NBC_01381]